MNSITITGRLTKDADLKYTSSGTAVANFTLASKRKFPDSNGELKSDFLQCTIWGKQAEALASYTRKGSLILVQGEQRTGSYDDQQGVTHYTSRTHVENFEFLETKEAIQQREQRGNQV
ncbi:single-stranded DNA-binding protein [Enterococcus faecium]|nr:single-stranded DNA-binding protein [Enterococcus faecium]